MGVPIIVDKIVKQYGKQAVLKDISFRVSSGELFGILAPDGAGKTTLFRIIASLLPFDRGNVKIGAWDIRSDILEIRKHIGYMPGRFSLYQDLSVEENLKLYATLYGTNISENYVNIRDIYSQIEPFKNRRVGDLSGGMKQKLALSCALVHKPDVLLLDEPTTGVDPISRCEFWNMLDVLRKRGMTILVSTPYMDEAERCDRIVLLQEGRNLGEGTLDSFISAFPSPLYAVKSDENYILLSALEKNPNILSCYISGQEIRVILNPGITPKDVPYNLYSVEPTIEDCFILLTSYNNGTK